MRLAPSIPRPSRFAQIFTTNIPNVTSPIWQQITLPLLEKLEVPMTIDEIVAWGIAQGDSGSVIRHKVAWLSFAKKIYYDQERKIWRRP